MLALLLAMIAFGWHHHAIPGVGAADPLMYTNLATYGFWVLWMMGVVLLALIFGRLWCSFCPLGWLNGAVAKLGLKLPLPEGLKNHYPATAALVGLQVVVYLLAIHRYPDYTAVLLSLSLGLALICGLLFRQRAFCRLFCPAGAVLALYGRVAPFELRTGKPSVCGECSSRRCVSQQSYWKRYGLGRAVLYWNGCRPGCPMDLEPARLTDEGGCTLCLHCVHHCEHDNLRLGFRSPAAELGRSPLSPSETLFTLVLLGMITANLSKVNVPLREVLFAVPERAALLLGWQASGYGVVATLWTCLLLPLILLLPALAVFGLRGLRAEEQPPGVAPEHFEAALPPKVRRGSALGALGYLLLPFIPLVLTAHLILALVKLNAKGGYLPLVLQDPQGVQSYLAMEVMHTLTQPESLFPLAGFKWLILGSLLAGYACSLMAARQVARAGYEVRESRWFLAASALGLSIFGGLYLHTVIRWLFIR